MDLTARLLVAVLQVERVIAVPHFLVVHPPYAVVACRETGVKRGGGHADNQTNR